MQGQVMNYLVCLMTGMDNHWNIWVMAVWTFLKQCEWSFLLLLDNKLLNISPISFFMLSAIRYWFCLPPHTTYEVQPLAMGYTVFPLFKAHYFFHRKTYHKIQFCKPFWESMVTSSNCSSWLHGMWCLSTQFVCFSCHFIQNTLKSSSQAWSW